MGRNHVAYHGNKDCNKDWLDGYFQAKKDLRDAAKSNENYYGRLGLILLLSLVSLMVIDIELSCPKIKS